MKLIQTVLLSFWTLVLVAQSQMSLEDCINYAIKNDGNLKNMYIDQQIQIAKNKEITALAYPQVNLKSNLNYLGILPKSRADAGAFNFGDAFSFFIVDPVKYQEYLAKPKSEYSVIQFSLPYSFSTGVEVGQLLYDPSVNAGLKARKSLVELTQLNIERTEEELKGNIAKAYYNALIAQRKLAFFDDNIALLNAIEKNVTGLFKEGFVERIDVDRITVQRNNLVVEKTKVQNLVDLSMALLKFQMAMPVENKISILDDKKYLEVDVDALLLAPLAIDQKMEMKLMNLGIDLQRQDYERYQKSWLPTVAFGLSGSYATQTKRFKELFTLSYFPTFGMGINATMPLYDGNARKYKMQQAQLNINKIENNKKTFERATNFQLENAKTQLINQKYSIKTQEENLTLATKVLDIAQKKYKEGLGSSLEIIQSQTAYKEAQTNYYDTLYALILSKIDLLIALGEIEKL